MTLLGFQLKRLANFPALWGFWAVCLGINIVLCLGNGLDADQFRHISAVASALGQQVDETFAYGLAHQPQTEDRDRLLQAVTEMRETEQPFDLEELSRSYQERVSRSPLAAQWIRWKYSLLGDQAAALAEEDAAIALYAGPMTHDSHQLLFGTLLGAISAESMILGALAALHLVGCDRITKTEQLFCTTRKGRGLWRSKVCAGGVAGLLLFALLAALSLGIYFSLWSYNGIWSANVSSPFHYVEDGPLIKPFLTWGSFSVAGYLAASLALIAGLTVIACLAASILGLLVPNVYGAALLLLLLCAGGLALPAACIRGGFWAAYEIANFQPIALWMTQSSWFTESGVSTVLPWQETIVSALWLVLCGGGAALALGRFGRKDLAS